MTSNPRLTTSTDLFFFFLTPKIFNEPFEFLLYRTNRLHLSVCVCVYCNRSQKKSACKEHKRKNVIKNVIYLLNTMFVSTPVVVIGFNPRTVKRFLVAKG